MNNIEKIKFGAAVFYYSAKSQMMKESTIGMAAMVGLGQGLKYNGNIKNGVKGGIATLLVLSGINGIMNVIENYDKIKNL